MDDFYTEEDYRLIPGFDPRIDIFDPGNYPSDDANTGPGGTDPRNELPLPDDPNTGPGGTDPRNENKADYKNTSNILRQLFSNPKQALADNPWLKWLIPGLFGAAGLMDKAKPSGGGVGYAYKGPAQQLTRTIVQGKYGPIAQHSVQAARGGIMQAYAQGGAVPIRTGNQMMEDGGFVMTKRAVDGAGGPQGIRQVLPRAQLFHGPGDGSGRDDRIKTGIMAANGGITPALVSKDEMYVPRRDVQQAGGPHRLHAMMKSLERRA